MSKKLQTVIAAMLKAGARETAFKFKRGAANTTQPAYSLASLSIPKCSQFREKYGPLLDDEPVTFFEHSLPAIEGAGPGGGDKLSADLWLILDSSVELQMAIIDRFVDDKCIRKKPARHLTTTVFEQFNRDPKAAIRAVIADQKRILGLVAQHTEYRIRKVMAATVVVDFRSKIDSATLSAFFPDVIEFMHRYNRFSLTEKAWRSMILKNQGIML